MTKHYEIRAQQRGLPPFVSTLLDIYGASEFDGHGCVIKYLNKTSLRKMEREMGREPVRKFAEWHDAYKVVRVISGETITIGHRVKRIKRN